MENTAAVQQAYALQAELDNVAAVLRRHAAVSYKIYNIALENNGSDSPLAIASKAELDKLTDVMEELHIDFRINSFYFTFGSDEKFPYTRGQYLVVKAYDINDAAAKFRSKYPNPEDNTVLNCADYYTQQEWDKRVKGFYKNEEPQEIIY